MAQSLLEVKNRIQTVQSIRKITNAMKLIANSRFNQLKSLYDGNQSYMDAIKEMMELCLLYVDYHKATRPTCLTQNPGNKKLYIFVTCTLGLCGSYFNNLNKFASKIITEKDDVIFIGEKGYRAYKHKVHRAYKRFIHLLDDFSYSSINLFRHKLDALYREEGYSSINIIYTTYINSMTTKCVCKKILPLDGEKIVREKKEKLEPLFEGKSINVADLIVPHYMDALLYRSFLESAISEQTNRKNSMENATSSADKLLYELQLEYNKVRQQKITNEINEIVSGSNDAIDFI